MGNISDVVVVLLEVRKLHEYLSMCGVIPSYEFAQCVGIERIGAERFRGLREVVRVAYGHCGSNARITSLLAKVLEENVGSHGVTDGKDGRVGTEAMHVLNGEVNVGGGSGGVS